MLLDTHVLLWWAEGDRRLGPLAQRLFTLPPATLRFSAVSAWEISIKITAGRLALDDEVEVLVARAGLMALPLTMAHALAAGRLPRLHGDPFDRALIAQAQVEGLQLVSADRAVLAYDVDSLDART